MGNPFILDCLSQILMILKNYELPALAGYQDLESRLHRWLPRPGVVTRLFPVSGWGPQQGSIGDFGILWLLGFY